MSQTPPQDPWGRPGSSNPEGQGATQPGRAAPPGWSSPPPPGTQPPGHYPPPGPYPPPGGEYPPPGGYLPPGGYQQSQPFGGGDYPSPPPVDAYGSGGWTPGPSRGRAGQLIGWWRRVGATIIDGLILGVVRTIFASALGTVGGDAIYIGLYATYAILLIGAPRAQTVGNMALTSRVVDASTGQPPGYNKAAVRWVVELVLNLTIIGGIFDILWPLWDSRNQTLHDKAAGTVVVFAA